MIAILLADMWAEDDLNLAIEWYPSSWLRGYLKEKLIYSRNRKRKLASVGNFGNTRVIRFESLTINGLLKA